MLRCSSSLRRTLFTSLPYATKNMYTVLAVCYQRGSTVNYAFFLPRARAGVLKTMK